MRQPSCPARPAHAKASTRQANPHDASGRRAQSHNASSRAQGTATPAHGSWPGGAGWRMLWRAMTDAVRTPDELLEGLPDFPFESRYREHEDLRLAHLDVGEGAPVVFMHGE